MSRHALSYLQLTGAITPERASRIVVVSTPEGQRTPLPTRSPEQPPNEKGRDIPPGIARMLQQIRTPQARPQPLPPRRETRPSARTSRAAALPTGPPAGFNIISTPSPRVLSRPGQYSPSPVAGGDFQLALSAARVPGTLVARMHTGGGGLTDSRIHLTCPPSCWRPYLRAPCLPREGTALRVRLMRTCNNTQSSVLPPPTCPPPCWRHFLKA